MIRARELWSGAVSKFKKPHPALKHGAYSSTALFPGKNAADFEKLHHAVIAEFAPMGALEEDIVATIAGLIWRKQNLTKFSIGELARKRLVELGSTEFPSTDICSRSATQRPWGRWDSMTYPYSIACPL